LPTILVFLFFALALGLAQLAGRRAIQGSCGGLGVAGCGVCTPEQKTHCVKRAAGRGTEVMRD